MSRWPRGRDFFLHVRCILGETCLGVGNSRASSAVERVASLTDELAFVRRAAGPPALLPGSNRLFKLQILEASEVPILVPKTHFNGWNRLQSGHSLFQIQAGTDDGGGEHSGSGGRAV